MNMTVLRRLLLVGSCVLAAPVILACYGSVLPAQDAGIADLCILPYALASLALYKLGAPETLFSGIEGPLRLTIPGAVGLLMMPALILLFIALLMGRAAPRPASKGSMLNPKS